MPEYKYICTNCKSNVIVELKITEAPLKVCPICKGEKCLNRVYDAVPFIDHTNGFYSRNNIK